MYSLITVTTLLYGSETWENNYKRLAKIKSTRSAAGYTLRDAKRNADIREELSVFSINKKKKKK